MIMKDKVIEVLGLGPSISEYRPSGNFTIGVNDIFRFHPADGLLLMDPPDSFSKDRLDIITDPRHKPGTTYSQLIDWNFMRNFIKIGVVDPADGGKVDTLDDLDCLPRHVDSTFTAVCIAYHLGASDIVMYGVDFTNHLKYYRNQIIQSYSRLHGALIQRGVLLWVGTDNSLLSEFIPNWHKTMEVI